jgi:hypothetical protein
MSVKRKIILPAILSVSTLGSILGGSAAMVMNSAAPAAVAASAHQMKPDFLYHG